MPRPRKNEKRAEYISRCVEVRQKEHPKEHPDQSVAICSSMWKKYKRNKK